MQVADSRAGDSCQGYIKKSTGPRIPPKIIVPQILDQSEGDKFCGPDWIDKSNMDKRIVGLIEAISSQNVSAELKFEVMQRAVATCPKGNMGCRRKIPSLLDSGSQVTLICQSYFEQEILPY